MNEKLKPSQTTKEVDGHTYIFQKLPNMSYLELRDRCKTPTGSLSDAKFYKEILNNIVVGVDDEYRKLGPDDFEDFDSMDVVVSEAVKFQHGKS